MQNENRNRWFAGKRFPTIGLKVLLVVLLILFGTIPMTVSSGAIITAIQQKQTDARMIEVQNRCQIVSSKMTRAGYLQSETRDAMIDNELDTIANVYNGRIVVVNRDFRVIRDTFKIAEKRLYIAEEVIRCFQGESSSKYNKDKHYFAQAIPVYVSDSDQSIAGVIVITASTEGILGIVDTVWDKALLFQLIVFFVLLGCALIAAQFVMEPFKVLQGKLNQAADGALDTDIHVNTYSETKRISQAVSSALTRLKEVDRSRQEFVSNVSHELKTPITSIRVLADSLIGMGDVPVELYREFMEDISDEIDRESQIIDDLLALVKMDKTEAELNITQSNINALVEQILKRLRPIANRSKVEVIFESIREVTADVDEVKLSLAITNLVENAIKYNKENGWVRVTLDADHKFFYIKVADSGIGIPEELQNRIFERFYRVDKARSRETGGSGLGLAITKSVVLMHKGAVKVSSKEGEGSVFTLRVPLNYIAGAGGKS